MLSFIGLLIAAMQFLDDEYGAGAAWCVAALWVMWLGLMLKQ